MQRILKEFLVRFVGKDCETEESLEFSAEVENVKRLPDPPFIFSSEGYRLLSPVLGL
jgi:hypothetical protein